MASINAKINQLHAKQTSLLCKIQMMYDQRKSLVTEESQKDFMARAELLPIYRKEFSDILDDINTLNSELDDSFVPSYESLSAFDDLYCFVIQTQKELQQKYPKIAMSFKKLPQLQLPCFSGQIEEWPSFFECFKAAIHENSALTDSEKLQYLLGKLSHKAFSICSAVPPIGSNYPIIWELLTSKYEDKRLLATSYLDQIFNLKVTSQTPEGLEAFLHKFAPAISALKNLQIDNLADFLILYIALKKIDNNLVKEFESLHRNVEIPTYDQFLQFLRQQMKIVERSPKNISTQEKKIMNPTASKTVPKPQAFLANIDNNHKCVYCKNDHPIYRCPKFLDLQPRTRFDFAKNHPLCLNCLSNRHTTNDCKSTHTCKTCSRKHNTLLHFIPAKPATHSPSQNNVVPRSSAQVSLCNLNNQKTTAKTILLSTIRTNMLSSSGNYITGRFLLDSGSMNNFVTKQTCKNLGIKITHLNSSVTGIGASSRQINGAVTLTIASRHDPHVKFTINALVIDKITDNLPTSKVDLSSLEYLTNIPLADDLFDIPGPIVGILGAELFGLLLRHNKISGPPNTPFALETLLGYVVIGEAPTASAQCSLPQSYISVTEEPLADIMKKFFEIEDVPSSHRHLSPDETECEKHFSATCTRDGQGRFIVALPFKFDPKLLGNSFFIAKRRLQSLERTLDKDADLRFSYNEVFQNYISEGYMSEVTVDTDQGYFVPHFGVFRPNALSTKLRIVYDASQKTDTGVSLNDLLYPGPKLQTDLCQVLLNFRLFPIAISSDIQQMYLRILIEESHQKFQRILYRFSKDDPIKVYEVSRVLFGLNCSPYLAIRTLHKLADENISKLPLAHAAIHRDFYVDDFVSSVETVEDAIKTYTELISLLASAKMNLTKWASNSPHFLEQVSNDRRLSQTVQFDQDASLKVLGLQWIPSSDHFTFKVTAQPQQACTKRIILSAIARFFDPLSLAGPCILYAKLLIKELWDAKVGWDDIPPQRIILAWKQFQKELPSLSTLLTPRHIGISRDSKLVHLLGFSDASTKAYGAVIYCYVVKPDGFWSISLICAKSKVSPVKVETLPRLELCAAVLLSKLFRCVLDTYQSRTRIDRIVAFSDSTVTLNWIHSSPHQWKTFVANRVAKIHTNLLPEHWHFVAGKDNPADCLSRGLTPNQLVQHKMWLYGPPWVNDPVSDWPIYSFQYEENTDMSDNKVVSLTVTEKLLEHPLYTLSQRISSWTKLLRIIAYIYKFAKLLPQGNRITSMDLNFAENKIIKVLQSIHFYDEVLAIKNNQNCSASIRKLRPFLDDEILRVGGRISHAALGYDQTHPILLPKKDHIVNLIIRHVHVKNCHTGPHLLLCILRKRYWILAARDVVRKLVQNCNICFRANPKPVYPLMADLPSPRVKVSNAFENTGVDFAGPITIKSSRLRTAKHQKSYICLFVCMSTKAVHLELVSDLSTPSFLAAFKRFLSRRGSCRTMFSDCGTNFVGTQSYLNDLYNFLKSEAFNDSLIKELNESRIIWKLNIPRASHHGSIWETNIRSTKLHLHRVIGEQVLTYEELMTVLIQIEAILNSRPLCVLSSDPSDPMALTPAHFLHSVPLKMLPSADVSDEPTNLLTRHSLLDKLVQSFWKRFQTEYLSTLQSREKWNTPSKPIQIGMLVILKGDDNKPLNWPIGIVDSVLPGQDGVVRSAVIRTRHGVFKRPAVRLCPLPTQ